MGKKNNLEQKHINEVCFFPSIFQVRPTVLRGRMAPCQAGFLGVVPQGLEFYGDLGGGAL